MTHKPSKVAAAESFSPVLIDATCFDECFLFHVYINGRHNFYKSLSLL